MSFSVELYTAILLLVSILTIAVINLRQWRLDRHKQQALLEETQHFKAASIAGQPPRLSFLLAAWNEQQHLARCLESILSLPYPNLEIVLCAGGQDGTFAAARAYASPNMILLEQFPGEGKQRALQRAFEASTGEVIYLTDADCVIQPDDFFRCLAPLLNKTERVVSGSFYLPLPGQEKHPFVLAQAASRAYSAAHQPAYSQGLQGSNCALSRIELEKAGAFQNSVKTGTDYDLAKRILKTGARIRFQALSSIRSEFPTSFRAYFRQQARWIRNVVLLGFRYQAYPEIRANLHTSLVGLTMLAGPFLILLAAWLTRWTAFLTITLLAGWFTLFLHSFFSRLRYLAFARLWLGLAYPLRSLWLLPLFLVVDFAAWSLPVLEYPLKSLRSRW